MRQLYLGNRSGFHTGRHICGNAPDLLAVCGDAAGCQSCADDLIPFFFIQFNDCVVLQFNGAGIFLSAFRTAVNSVHVLSADRSDLLQGIDHSIHGGRADLVVLLGGLIIDLLTAGAVLLQNDIQKDKPLLGDAKSLFLQLLDDQILLHLCSLVISLIFQFPCSGILWQFLTPPKAAFLFSAVASAVLAFSATLQGLTALLVANHTPYNQSYDAY